MNETILSVTDAIIKRSAKSRAVYLERIAQAKVQGVNRNKLGCSNLAHAMAPMDENEKNALAGMQSPNIAIVTAYNDMLSAHEPYKLYPALIKRTFKDLGATAQVAGGVPAMCDGITQSQPGMELSLFSRDNIAMGTAIGLSHNVYDGALYLGVCDKIVPGLVIGALAFGHLPGMFVPAGPMPSGISNAQKAKVRQEFAQGKVSEDSLLKVEAASYHSSGTCTFYGTANSNQMLLEMMGLQLPNSSFVNTNTPLREALTAEAAKTIVGMTNLSGNYKPIAEIIDEKSFVNAIVGLMATGGSTNHTIHIIAMARAAGIVLNWDDFDAISKVTPLLCKMYPNGQADVNHFRDAGGMSVVISQLLDAGLVHNDVQTVVGKGLDAYIAEPTLNQGSVIFQEGAKTSRDTSVIASIQAPFSTEGGLKLLNGNLGRSVIKTSALKPEQFVIEAEAIVFESQESLQTAFKKGELEKDFIAVVRYQGPKSNGMPELHGLMPPLGVLQDKGFKVAIVTDGRMSGASGKVPSAIHLSPEALDGGMLAKVKTGDMIRFDAQKGEILLLVEEEELQTRSIELPDMQSNRHGFGRELFVWVRQSIGSAEEGACVFDISGKERA
ncbi:MAG TPA: phosphogluconate dehydratase [Sulfurovum sp.]|jgi:phosphogluconate dehydratase|nr:MAG: phosphogluconate dehydratase [Sulfurovum sp. 35-42-20]OYY55820.1 MAG: phosphogluconate dehydratase [Sulfurovum sp. 28-43-6]OYZ25667.1 MAG: phosphogluconate dehydratase [Sulfurovum sp. 16-42-52]OYZ50210.1 MAG: phosphogluconate dehydratase [Sulfurovum sp. 24-42-9]OZA45784.1 MAG: phosphogluconate dehydratase [Sulfurovum sp. 17-42-90]OZA60256.1 MAG: phosphogluconate dehydratase [Sulfurovum sp. 39-42-12]HQR73289.1 phosphogluconate dehydratase [Sulfurovum sp.]